MLLTIAGVLLILWIIGLVAHVAGAFIHIVLLVAVAVFIMHFLKRNKA